MSSKTKRDSWWDSDEEDSPTAPTHIQPPQEGSSRNTASSIMEQIIDQREQHRKNNGMVNLESSGETTT